jgi:hypothetical protein
LGQKAGDSILFFYWRFTGVANRIFGFSYRIAYQY